MGNKPTYQKEVKPDKIDIYTHGKDGRFNIVYSYHDVLVPYSGNINWANDETSEILAIKKALERVDKNTTLVIYTNCKTAYKYFPNIKFEMIPEGYAKSMLNIKLE